MGISMKNYNLDVFDRGLDKLGISLSEIQKQMFLNYYELIIEWNSFMNLTAITEFDDVCMKHFIDSLSLITAVIDIDKREYSIIDVGTGAGFPAIPLKLAFPQLKITMLDSLGKRVKFLDEVISALKLDGISAIHGRAEDYARGNFRESFDICVSRAVANLSTLAEYCIPYVKKDGFFIPYKSGKITDEIYSASNAIAVLGGSVEKQVDFQLPDSDIQRSLLVIKKIKSTPGKYPRKAGLPSKEPLV